MAAGFCCIDLNIKGVPCCFQASYLADFPCRHFNVTYSFYYYGQPYSFQTPCCTQRRNAGFACCADFCTHLHPALCGGSSIFLVKKICHFLKPLESSWKFALAGHFGNFEFINLAQFVVDAYSTAERGGPTICPSKNLVFRAFDLSTFANTKVVILGQDPYHQPGRADGLAFSMNREELGSRGLICGSLNNILKELKEDGYPPIIPSCCLDGWAREGVLLLNSVLTVEAGTPNSHAERGWEHFTDAVIRALNSRENLVFILWGKDAQKKRVLIDPTKHKVIESGHPSSLALSKRNQRPFLGSKPFSEANRYLEEKNQDPIPWERMSFI